MFRHKFNFLFFIVFLMVFVPICSVAQSLRDMVDSHVEESLEKEKKKKQQPPAKQTEKHRESKKTEPIKETQPQDKKKEDPENTISLNLSFSTKNREEKIYDYPELPKRVLHKWVRIDPSIGIGYRGWVPQDYPNIKTHVASYFTWQAEIRGRFFNLIHLKRGYYESSGLSSPRHSHRKNVAKYGNYAIKSAWFLAELGIPIANAWEPTIRYDTRSFSTTAVAKNDSSFCLVDYNTDAYAQFECPQRDTRITMISTYETAALGVTYYPDKNPSAVIEDTSGKVPPFFFGLGYLSYAKPYQLTIGNQVLEELLFSGRFYGGGLAFGTKAGGGVNRFYLDIWTQVGLGASKITRNLSLNEVAPSNWLIGYLQGNLALAYKWAPFKFAPTILLVPQIKASGTTFFFFETKKQKEETIVMPNINWDIIYAATLSLVITL